MTNKWVLGRLNVALESERKRENEPTIHLHQGGLSGSFKVFPPLLTLLRLTYKEISRQGELKQQQNRENLSTTATTTTSSSSRFFLFIFFYLREGRHSHAVKTGHGTKTHTPTSTPSQCANKKEKTHTIAPPNSPFKMFLLLLQLHSVYFDKSLPTTRSFAWPVNLLYNTLL